MISLNIHAQGDACWEDLQSRSEQLIWLNSGAGLAIARLPRGMASGRSSVAIRVDLPDGRVVVAETSMALFLACAGAFKAADEAEQPGVPPAKPASALLTDKQIAEVIAQRDAPPEDGGELHDWVMTFARDLLARAASEASSAPAEAINEPPSQRQQKLMELADRIDPEELWRRPGLEHLEWPQDKRDRLEAGVQLRRYADLLQPGRWLIIPPTGPVQFSAQTLDAAYAMAVKHEGRAAAPSARSQPEAPIEAVRAPDPSFCRSCGNTGQSCDYPECLQAPSVEAPAQQAEADGLSPCAHCGSEAVFGTCDVEGDQSGGEYIECTGCGATTALVFPCMGDAKTLLRERWNRRATAPSVVEQAGMSSAARDMLAERRRQIDVKGWAPEHDDEHVNDEIAALACFYAMPPGARDWSARETGYGDTFGEAILPDGWPAETGDRREELVKAGALILAEIERLDRAAAAADHAVDAPVGDPWTRDPESTQGLLTLVGLEPSLDTIASWTDEQCQQAEAWAAATHLNASDNDHVVVPPRPAFLPKPWEGPIDNQWGNGPTQF